MENTVNVKSISYTSLRIRKCIIVIKRTRSICRDSGVKFIDQVSQPACRMTQWQINLTMNTFVDGRDAFKLIHRNE